MGSSAVVQTWLYCMISYLRLKNVRISCKFHKNYCLLCTFQRQTDVSGENLFTLTNYPGLDPEKPRSGRDLYPINRSYSVGVNVGL